MEKMRPSAPQMTSLVDGLYLHLLLSPLNRIERTFDSKDSLGPFNSETIMNSFNNCIIFA